MALKEAFFHRIASLRASTDAGWTYSPFIPYDSLLVGGRGHGRVVRDKAVCIEPERRQVVLTTGHRVPYDAPPADTWRWAGSPRDGGGRGRSR